MRCRTALSQYSNRIATASATLDLRLMKHTADSRLQFLLGLSMPCNRQGLPSTASFLTYTKNTFLHIHVILEGMTFNDLTIDLESPLIERALVAEGRLESATMALILLKMFFPHSFQELSISSTSAPPIRPQSRSGRGLLVEIFVLPLSVCRIKGNTCIKGRLSHPISRRPSPTTYHIA